jgi:hypothetical protein
MVATKPTQRVKKSGYWLALIIRSRTSPTDAVAILAISDSPEYSLRKQVGFGGMPFEHFFDDWKQKNKPENPDNLFFETSQMTPESIRKFTMQKAFELYHSHGANTFGPDWYHTNLILNEIGRAYDIETSDLKMKLMFTVIANRVLRHIYPEKMDRKAQMDLLKSDKEIQFPHPLLF